MNKTFVLDIEFDNGAVIEHKKAVCIASDRATAIKLVKDALEKQADDIVNIQCIREMLDNDVVIVE